MAAKRKAPPKCGKAQGHDHEQQKRSDRLHEEIKRVNDELAKCILEKRELELRFERYVHPDGVAL